MRIIMVPVGLVVGGGHGDRGLPPEGDEGRVCGWFIQCFRQDIKYLQMQGVPVIRTLGSLITRIMV